MTYHFFKENEFADYLDLQKKPKKYVGHVRTIYKKFLVPIDLIILFDDLENCIAYYKKKKKPDEALKGLKLVSNFIRRIHSLTKIESPIGDASRSFLKNEINIKPDPFMDYATALDLYISFMEEHIKGDSYSKPEGKSNIKYGIAKYINVCKRLDSLFYEKIKIDGIDSLMDKFSSSNKAFISYVLKKSFFFSQKMAIDQFVAIAKKIQNRKPVDARSRGRKRGNDKNSIFLCKDEIDGSDKEILITIDENGNKPVRDLIEKMTGYTISSGENCLFINYVISHIWGEAFDPRHFTNFWNLALVPAWANPLLDKKNYSNELTRNLLNTFKAICLKQYGMNSKKFNWKSIYKKCPSLDPNYVVTGDYMIYVIQQRKKKKSELEPFGTIKVCPISINVNDIESWRNLFQ